MITILLCLLSGDCYVQPLRQVQAYQLHQQAYYQVVPLYVPQQTGEQQRIKALEDAVLKLTQISEQQQLLIQQGGPLLQTASKYDAQARAILKRSCVSCHSGSNPEGGFTLGSDFDTGTKLLIAEVVADGTMPKNNPLPDDDQQVLVEWSREDKAAVREFLRGGLK